MKFGKLAASVAVLSLVATPVAAQQVSSLARTVERISATSENGEKAEGSTGIIIGVVAAAAVIGGIILIADDDEPSSP